MSTRISMRLSDLTISRVESIKASTQEKSKTKVVSIGIEVLDLLVKEIQTGGKLVIHKKDGSKELLKIIGV
jgi:hypothetical protein